MRRTHVLLFLALASPTVALAQDVSVGLSVGAGLDLPDKASADHTRFGVGPTLSVPVRIGLADQAWLTATLRGDLGTGRDRVSWSQPVGDTTVRIASTEHWAMLSAASFTVGAEGRVPLGDSAVEPLFGAAIGGAWIATWHSFGVSENGSDTTLLLDPDQNDLSSPSNIDPYAMRLSLLVDARIGAAWLMNDTVELIGEIGYSTAYVSAAELRKAPPELAAQRDAFGWNPLRLQVGVAFRL